MSHVWVLVAKLALAWHGVHGVALWAPHGDDPYYTWQDSHCTTWVRVNEWKDVCR